MPLQCRPANSQTNSHNFKFLIEFTYGDFPCHLKVNGNKLASSSVLHRNSLKYSNDQRGKLDYNWLSFYVKLHRERDRITRRYSAEQTHTEFTYGDFPYHLKANRSKLALINRLWKCRKGEGLTITTHSFTKIDQLDGFCLLWRSDLKIPSAPGTNQIAGFVEFRPLTSWEKDKSFC